MSAAEEVNAVGRMLVVVIVLGLVIYLAIRLVQRPGEGPGRVRRPPKPIAPDDDPTFLRDLDSQLWQRRQHGDHPDDPPR